MLILHNEIKYIKLQLHQWFSRNQVMIGAAKIENYPILKQERELIANAVFHRQCEFATGRWLARTGLRKFGFDDKPIYIGHLKNPLWPSSIVGTISHDYQLCVVVLMQKKCCLEIDIDIGIDLFYLPQRGHKMSELLSIFIARPDELIMAQDIEQHIRKNITANININAATILFSIKESIVKAISYQVNNFIDLRAIDLTETSITNNISNFRFEGQKIHASIFTMVTGDYLLTAVKVFN